MKKIICLLMLTIFTACIFTGCTEKPFSFKEPMSEIESVEIVLAESSLEYTIVKTLSQQEVDAFIEAFSEIEFRRYLGDPPGLRGDAIKITYESGIYVMIDDFATEYVEDGRRQYLHKSCGKEAFADLLEQFSTSGNMQLRIWPDGKKTAVRL